MYKMTSFCIKLFPKKKKKYETTLFYNSLNLTLYSLLPSHFMPLCYHASLLNHIAQQHRYYLSLSKNFLKLKLDYKSYIYMLNIIHTHTHTHIYIYIWRSVRLLIGMQNLQPFAAPAIVGTWKSPPTTMPYTIGGAL